MVRLAAADGATDIVATPHASPEYRYDAAVIDARLAEIRAALPDGPRLHRGCDFHLSYENIQDALAHPRKFTIAGQCYLLVEFPDLAVFPNTAEIFARLLDAGMVPVVTHPERNPLLRQKLDDLASWSAMGALIQLTAGSLLGDWGNHARQCCEALLKRRLVDCIASDAHDTLHRPPVLSRARDYLARQWSPELAALLTEHNPRAILSGQEIERASTRPARKWYRFW
jgi:protein-tyrosine phosphatase